MSPAKHSYASVTDGQTDDGKSDPYVSLCFAGDTKTVPTWLNPNVMSTFHRVFTQTKWSFPG